MKVLQLFAISYVGMSACFASDLTNDPALPTYCYPSSCAKSETTVLHTPSKYTYWRIVTASHEHMIGSVIKIQDGRFWIPFCGLMIMDPVPDEEKSGRTDKTMKASVRFVPEMMYLGPSFCRKFKHKEMNASLAYSENVGSETIDLSVYDEQQKAVLNISFWNMEKNEPGETGSGYGSSFAVYMDLKILKHVFTYEIANGLWNLPKYQQDKYSEAFNLSRFTQKAKKFCDKKEAKSGGGHWPAVWQQACLYQQLDAKLNTLLTWQECSHNKKTKCIYPNERLEKIENENP